MYQASLWQCYWMHCRLKNKEDSWDKQVLWKVPFLLNHRTTYNKETEITEQEHNISIMSLLQKIQSSIKQMLVEARYKMSQVWSARTHWKGMQISTTTTRGVHGSVRFGLDLKNQPNRITLILWNINRTGPKTGSNQTGPVRLNPVFLAKNRET